MVWHAIDVMHVEKNVFDSLIGTLLDIPGKTKDTLNARLDLEDMKLRKILHPKILSNDHVLFTQAHFVVMQQLVVVDPYVNMHVQMLQLQIQQT